MRAAIQIVEKIRKTADGLARAEKSKDRIRSRNSEKRRTGFPIRRCLLMDACCSLVDSVVGCLRRLFPKQQFQVIALTVKDADDIYGLLL